MRVQPGGLRVLDSGVQSLELGVGRLGMSVDLGLWGPCLFSVPPESDRLGVDGRPLFLERRQAGPLGLGRRRLDVEGDRLVGGVGDCISAMSASASSTVSQTTTTTPSASKVTCGLKKFSCLGGSVMMTATLSTLSHAARRTAALGRRVYSVYSVDSVSRGF